MTCCTLPTSACAPIDINHIQVIQVTLLGRSIRLQVIPIELELKLLSSSSIAPALGHGMPPKRGKRIAQAVVGAGRYRHPVLGAGLQYELHLGAAILLMRFAAPIVYASARGTPTRTLSLLSPCMANALYCGAP